MIGDTLRRPQSFEDVLQASKTQTGRYSKTAVEKVMLKFLKTAKLYRGVFENVWLWRNSPYANATKSPISMVGQGHDLTKTAILCHFGNLGLGKVVGFLDAVRAEKFDHIMIMHADGKISARAYRLLKEATAVVLSHKELDEFDIGRGFGMPPKVKALRKSQSDAVGKIAMGLAHSNKGKVVMPPGTGKTLVSLKVAERVVGKNKTILVAASSFKSMLQAMREWSDNSDISMHVLAAHSKEGVRKDVMVSESYIPLTHDSKMLAKCSHRHQDAMVVIFTTHDMVEDIITASGIRFDLAIYYDAHLLVVGKGKDQAPAGKPDSHRYIYMTSTPQIPDSYRIRSGRNALLLDDQTYGKELYRLGFDDAVKEGVVADFRIRIVIVSNRASKLFGGTKKGMSVKDKLVGVASWQALLQPDKKLPVTQKILALTRSTSQASKWNRWFGPMGKHVMKSIPSQITTRCAVKNDAELGWFADTIKPNVYRILFSQKVPDIEMPGVLFLDTLGSTIEASRCMENVIRKQSDTKKETGYLLVPVVLPAGESISKPSDYALRSVWTVLAAVVAHHPGFQREAAVFDLERTPKFQSGANSSLVIPVGDRVSVEVLATPYELKRAGPAEIARYIRRRVVTNTGGAGYYKAYLEKVVETALVLEDRMIARVANSPLLISKVEPLIKALKVQIGGSITQAQAVRIMVQHILFAKLLHILHDTRFVERDPVARIIQEVVTDTGMVQDMWIHQEIYQDMNQTLRYIKTAEQRRGLIKLAYHIYNDRKSSGKTRQISDTPEEIIDFIIRSVQHILFEEFNSDLGDSSVRVLNPFAGSGGFVDRLLEIMSDDSLYGKYGDEIYASDMALPAYYTTAACAEITHQMTSGTQQNIPFEGTTYTDVFRTVDTTNHILTDATRRVRRQHADNVRVIIGDPPGVLLPESELGEMSHSELEARIVDTYVASARHTGHSASTINRKNPYIKAQRWATDRLRGMGVIGFVVPAMYITKDAKAGMRASMLVEFTDMWCLDICQRGEFASKDDQLQDVVIVIMVRNPRKSTHTVRYAGIGKRYVGKDKRNLLRNWQSIKGIKAWRKVRVSSRHRWMPT